MRSTCRAFVLLAAGLPVTASAADCHSLAALGWLLGDWVADGEARTVYESWMAAGPDTFEGAGSEVARADGRVASAESLRLVRMSGGIFYLAKVDHNELPVAFRLTACSGGHFVFENAAHDFPRRLDYGPDGDDALNVRVSDGADKGFTIVFRRTDAATANDATVLAAEDSRFAAMVAADPAAMRRWLADDLEYVHSTGKVESREQLIDSIVSGRARYLSATPLERRVVPLAPDVALVRGRGHFLAEAGGAKLDLTLRYLAVYARDAGDWRLIGWQSLRIDPQ